MSRDAIASLPATFLSLLAPFAVLFRPGNFQNFLTGVVGWILSRGSHTISGALRAHGPGVVEKHFSSIYAFFSRGRWVPDVLGEELFRLLIPRLPDLVHVLIDDTLCRKTGPHLWGAGMHHDAVASTYGRFGAAARHVAFAFGHNFVVLALWIPLPWSPNGIALPILFRLYRSKKLAPETEYRKRTELARELLEILHGWNEEYETGKRILVLADSEYSCKTLIKVRPAGVDCLGPLPQNAAIYDRPPRHRKGRGAPRKKGGRLSTPAQWAKDDSPWEKLRVPMYGKLVTILIKTRVCLWYTVAGVQPVRVVLTRDPSGRLEDRAFFSTDPRMPARVLLSIYSRRWSLEVTFFNVKQFLGLENPQNGWWRRPSGSPAPPTKKGPNPQGDRGRQAVERTVPAMFFTYAFVYLWYLDHGRPESDAARAHAAAPWYRSKKRPSFADILAALRWEIIQGKIHADPDLARLSQKIGRVLHEQLRAA